MMSILSNLIRAQKAYQRKPLLVSATNLALEYDSTRRAYLAAMAGNNAEGALLWSARANCIAREMARMQDIIAEAEDEPSPGELRSA